MTRGTASARPERLGRLAETTHAIAEALDRRAGWLDDAWDTYATSNEADWRFDFSGVGDAVRAWGDTLADIGEWTGLVGTAFEEAGGRTTGGVRTVRESRMLDLLPCAARAVVEAIEISREVDWGDPDGPPDWLEDLQTTAMVVGHAETAVDIAEATFVVGTGADARWHAATPAVLGRFASARSLSSFAELFSVGTAGVGGVAAGAGQWFADSTSYRYTDGEVRVRAATRGAATGGAALASSALLTVGAGALCGPGAPVCAGVVIVGGGLVASTLTDIGLDRVLGAPGPAEHDHDVVVDEITGLAPGHLPRDVSDAEWEVLEVVDAAGEDAGELDYERRHRAILADDVTPETIAADDLPPTWVEERTR